MERIGSAETRVLSFCSCFDTHPASLASCLLCCGRLLLLYTRATRLIETLVGRNDVTVPEQSD